MVQYGFIIRKPHRTAPYYIINSLITPVFQKKKFDNPSKCWLEKPTQNKEKLAQ